MRRFYLYAVVGLFASLLWAGTAQTSVYALQPGTTQAQPSIVTPTRSFAEIIQWAELDCKSEEGAISLSGGLTSGLDLDIHGSNIVTDYVVCPIVQSMYAGIGVIINAIEATGLLAIPSLLTGGTATSSSQKGIFAAWSVMRDFANVGLVIGLFFVIFSQATSYGLSAYGVKKMLPKVVIAALLVNLSYIICAILVDGFNILGATLDDLINSVITAALAGSGAGSIGDMIGEASPVVTAALLIGGPLGVLVMAFMFLIIFFLILCFGLIAVVFLVARQIFVICLIIAAPLAFIAWLFPNTEGQFRKWWSVLIKLLAIYPIVMCLKVVSYVIIIAMAGLIGI